MDSRTCRSLVTAGVPVNKSGYHIFMGCMYKIIMNDLSGSAAQLYQ